MTCDRPYAAAGLNSYRYASRWGWIMIGARDDAQALTEARRSTEEPVALQNLQAWDGAAYVPVAA